MVNGDENHTAIEFSNPQDDIFEKIDGEDDLGGMFD
jgi:hypothetical protein